MTPHRMRALAAALSLFLALVAVAPHAHPLLGGEGTEECAVCVARGGDVARAETPVLAPVEILLGEVVLRPGLAPVSGAPLGAIPGQSPPSASR